MNEQLTTTQTKVMAVDTVVQTAMEIFGGEATTISQALTLSNAIGDIEAALTPEILRQLTRFQDTRIGFLTDRDPNKRDKEGKPFKPYPESVMKRCLIEALLRGLQVCGNQFNIISAGQYITREGYEYLIKHRVKGVSCYKETIGIPKMQSGGAVVLVTATWKKNGVTDSIDCEIPVKVNTFMGADAIVGKAERKLRRRAYEQMSGRSTPDGDIEDAPVIPVERQIPDASPDDNLDMGEPKPCDLLRAFIDFTIKDKKGFKLFCVDQKYIVNARASVYSMTDESIEALLSEEVKPHVVDMFGEAPIGTADSDKGGEVAK